MASHEVEMVGYEIQYHNGNKVFVCQICQKVISTKQRVKGHILLKHSGNEIPVSKLIPQEKKEDCYTSSTDGKCFCKICHKTLSSKQRILLHLNKQHGKSPVRKRYKIYEDEDASDIPKSTHYYRSKRSLNSSFEYNAVSCRQNEDEPIPSTSNHLNEDIEGDYFEKSENEISFDPDEAAEQILLPSNSSCEENSSESEDCFSDSSIDSDSSSCNTTTCSSTDQSISDEDPSETENTGGPLLSAEDYCILSYARRYNLSKEASRDLFRLVSAVSPDTNVHIDTLQSPNDNWKTIHYCEKCNALFPDDQGVFICKTSGCLGLRYKGGDVAQSVQNRQARCSFILTDIENQTKLILERENVWELVQSMKCKSLTRSQDGCIRDIIDGNIYQSLCSQGEFLNNSNNISALMNTDGIPLYSSSKVKLWPIFLAINELPPSQRFSRSNLILAGIWQGKGNPPFLQYLYSFGNSIERLRSDGFYIQPQNYEKTKVRLSVICASVDLQAKGYVANMTMHNGAYGCSTCEEPGLIVSKGKGHVNSYPYRSENQKPATRTNECVREQSQNATSQRRIKGICGPSGLQILPDFDIVHGLVPDYMHGVLLGVTKSLMQLWFSPSNSSKPFYIGKHLEEISSKIEKMTPPDSIERLPRSLEKHYQNYKASEYQTWLLYYAIPSLKGVLPDLYLEHLSHLSEVTFLLLGENITSGDLERSSTLMENFYKEFEILYGKEACGLNVHNVGAHIVHFVQNWGPLWAWSCFAFEDANADILQAVCGTGDVTKQYVNTKILELQLKTLDISEHAKTPNQNSFLTRMLQRGRPWTKTIKMNNCSVAGKLLPLCLLESGNLINTNLQNKEVQKCLRVEILGQKFYCEQYKRMKKRVCHFIVSNIGDIFSIQYFLVESQGDVFAVCKKYEAEEHCFLFESSGHHLFKIKESEENEQLISVTSIKEKGFYIKVNEDIYFSLIPNMIGHSVLK